MNNSELLKKISKKSGAPETESAAFFEILVRKVSKVLKDDEIIKLDDIGFLKIINKDQNKIITFSNSEIFDEENSIFYLINDSEPVFDPVDSFFSISLEKPEIPLNEPIDSEFFVPPAGYELRSFMESKADDLLLESKIIKAENIGEEKIEDQIIEPPEIKVDEKIKIEDEVEKNDILSDDNLENVFDESEKDENSEIKPEDSFSNVELQEMKEDFLKDDVSSEIKIEDYNFSEIKNIDDSPAEEEPKEKAINKTDKFQKVTSLLSKIPQDPEVDSNLNEDSENISFKKPGKEEIDEKGFSKVKFNRIKSIEDDVKEKLKVEKKRKVSLVPIIFLILIAAAFIVYKFFVNNDQNNNIAEVKSEAALTPSDPKIIERNYDIPVNYPYKNEDDLLFNAVDPSVYSEKNDAQKSVQSNEAKIVSENKPVAAQNNFSQSQTNLENAEPIPAENYQEITNYIYSDGKIYFIQVASWNSLARAERHNSNLLKKGYNSSIEKLISPKGNIYYIIKLGSFNSRQEAENYLKQN